MQCWLVLRKMLDFVCALGSISRPPLRTKDYAVSGIFQTKFLEPNFCSSFW
ncbi:hypothetical protein RHMOL_Rhmol12G0053900 [Rhododendron molle]|uniref:Uncharacterized protein n=1 Tax=Rhododendron molle TaxID=49168 RepID=A0ACC0LEI8_RHOML|nr:hypothetical protein RHMOL_Rhmol12G0053900 [Rhododendron molle]